MNEFLYTFSDNVFSDNGEDGINQKIFEHLKIKDGVLLEIGAWDGFHSSNCANLWSKDKNFKSILIESTNRLDKIKLESEYDNIECFNIFVNENSTLEKIIDECKFYVNENNFVLCSIDVDGPDIEVANSLGKYKPKILILESNGTLNNSQIRGVSIEEWIDWADEMKYSFIGMSGIVNQQAGNLYFCRNDLKKHFSITKEHWKKRGILLSGGLVYE